MQYFLYVFCRILSLLLSTVMVAMLLRTILSWFDIDDDNRFLILLCLLTEPVVAPFRALLARFGIGEDLPVDVGFFVAMLVVVMCVTFFPEVTL